MEVITVSELYKHYDQVKALDGVSFSVRQGEVFGIIGPNGAGKTTLIEVIVGLIKRDSGTISVLGLDPEKNKAALMNMIGVQLQSASLFPRLTVKEIITLFESFYLKRMNVKNLISLLSLEEKANTQCKKLSGGQLQRLNVILSFLGDCDLVFLDEPTSGLDPQARHALWNVIKHMQENGKTIVLTTHQMDEAEKLCNRVIILDYGKIISRGEPSGIVNEYYSEKAIVFDNINSFDDIDLNTIPCITKTQAEKESLVLFSNDVSRTMIALMQSFNKLNRQFSNFTVRTATLEDVFLKITGRAIRE